MKLGGGVLVGAAGENVGDLVMGGKEALNLPRRLEPLHDPLASSGRLMRILGPVVEALVLPVLNPGHNLPLGGAIAAQLVGDQHTGRSQVLLDLLDKVAKSAVGFVHTIARNALRHRLVARHMVTPSSRSGRARPAKDGIHDGQVMPGTPTPQS